jgi:signal transduction histidine kinase/ActR/RegA family two-component response regulator
MSSDTGALSLLTAKAMLLLRREHELYALRLERERIELWNKVFHKLSPDLEHETPGSLVQKWTRLMVGELSFQIAAVYTPVDEGSAVALLAAESHVPMPERLGLNDAARRFLGEHPVGDYRLGAPEPLDVLARAAGFEDFFWMLLRTRVRSLLLLCGFAAAAGNAPTLNAYDSTHFELSGKHLGALLENLGLIGELDRERSELAASNDQLEQAMAELRRETSERLQLERELRHSQKLEALGRMVAGIGHEINNPLAYVLSNLEYVQRETRESHRNPEQKDPAALAEAIAEAISGAERIRSIVNATREFSRPLEEAPRAVDVRECLDAAHRIVANELRHRAKLAQTLENVPHVMADPHRLGQVFVNLLVNAVHSMPEGRPENEIRVTCSQRDESHVTVSVSDNGRGIAEHDLDRVFEPFFSSDAHSKGMGLGLSICRGIIDGFGGNIEIDSQVGRGTTVTVQLRVAPDSPEAEAALRQSLVPEGDPTRPARVLLIDDEPAVLRGLGRVLRGHEVVMATDGREGVELYKSGRFDIVFCDLMMPGFSGVDFVQELERLGPGHAQRVVLMTGGIVSDAIRSSVSKSPSVCITKPLDSAQLRRLIAKSVSAPSQPPNGSTSG